MIHNSRLSGRRRRRRPSDNGQSFFGFVGSARRRLCDFSSHIHTKVSLTPILKPRLRLRLEPKRTNAKPPLGASYRNETISDYYFSSPKTQKELFSIKYISCELHDTKSFSASTAF